jgi:hypothetical protein
MGRRGRAEESKRRVLNPIHFMWPTSDDWHPNFQRNTVSFNVFVYHGWDNTNDPHHKRGMIKINISGADDTCMAMYLRELPESEYDATVERINLWIRTIPNPVTQDWLRTQGFQRD